MAIELQESKKSRVSSERIAASLRRDGTVRLQFSKPMIEMLERLSTQTHLPIEQVMTQGVMLLQVAVEAQMRGQKLYIVDDKLDVETEINGFGIHPSVEMEPEEDQAD